MSLSLHASSWSARSRGACLAVLLPAARSAAEPTDLDAFMARVLARRDDNWKKLQQYVLDERETFQMLGPGGAAVLRLAARVPVVSARRRLHPQPAARRRRDARRGRAPQGRGRSGCAKRKARDKRRDRRRDGRRIRRRGREHRGHGDGVRQALEPGFVSAAYFLKFKFDPGQYALAGRETLEGRPVLRIEYYPDEAVQRRARAAQPQGPRARRGHRAEDEQDGARHALDRARRAADPEVRVPQPAVGLPAGRAIVRVDSMTASMEMGQPFPDVWLPRAHSHRHRPLHRRRRPRRPFRHRVSRLPSGLGDHEDPVSRALIVACVAAVLWRRRPPRAHRRDDRRDPCSRQPRHARRRRRRISGLEGRRRRDRRAAAEAEQALRASDRFDGVEVLKRFRSLDDPGRHPGDHPRSTSALA